MRPIFFYPYRKGSMSVMGLCDELDARAIKLVGSKYRSRANHLVVNWGNGGECPYRIDLNQPEAVRRAIHKMRSFAQWQDNGVPCPEFTKSIREAQEWVKVGKVLGRDAETGRAGAGITVYQKGSKVGHHKFYVKYHKKEREFRIHVFNGKVIFEQEKLKEKGYEGRNQYVRSHKMGWVFAFKHLQNKPVPDVVREASIKAVESLGLDFGGVDVGWNERQGACVFEVNTAPGIEESSLRAYAKALRELAA